MTAKPFGVNLPLAFLREPEIVDMIVAEGVEFVDDLGRLARQVHARCSRTPD